MAEEEKQEAQEEQKPEEVEEEKVEAKKEEKKEESKPESSVVAEAKTDKKPEPKVKEKVAPTAVGVPTEVGKVPAKFKKLVEEIEEMSIMELAELVKVLEKKFGVSPMMAAPTAAGVSNNGGGTEIEEKTEFAIELKDAGGQKIQVIKVVRDMTGKGLKEAKDLVDAVPKTLKENVKKEEAEELKKKLEDAGATVELK